MKIFCSFFIALIISLNAYSQEKTIEYTIDEGFILTEFAVLENDNTYIIERSESKKEKIRTKFSLLDTHLNFEKQYTSEQYISFNILSQTGNNILSYKDKTYSLVFNDNKKFSDKNIDEDITDEFYYSQADKFIDVVKINFLTDTKFVSIGRKEGKEYYKKGYFGEIDIFLFKKDLKTLKTSYVKLEYPKDNHFYSLGPKLLHYNEDSFMLSYMSTTTDKERLYIVTTHDYSGKIIKESRLTIKVEDKEQQKFTVLNVGTYSFGTYNPYDVNTLRNKNIIAYSLPTSDARGDIVYDKYENTFYAYAGIKPKKGDSGVLIYKYNIDGNVLWKKYHVFPNTSLHYINSANRYLTFDISSNFIGVSLYSTKGKNYCDFYVINKETGEIIINKNFRKFKFYKSGKNYNNLYARFITKEGKYDNLILDRNTIFSSLYSNEFRTYLENINSKEPSLFISYFTKNGVNTLSSTKKDKKIIFNKFKF